MVRKAAVNILKNEIDNMRAGRLKEKLVNGKFVKTSFDKMPSPSSFGGGIAVKLNLKLKEDRNEPASVNRADYEGIERRLKPFAEFTEPSLKHLNSPQIKDYLKQPRRIKFDRKPKEIAQTEPVGVFKVKRYEKIEPFSDADFKNMANKAKRMNKGEKKSIQLISHLGSKRTVPVKDFQHV